MQVQSTLSPATLTSSPTAARSIAEPVASSRTSSAYTADRGVSCNVTDYACEQPELEALNVPEPPVDYDREAHSAHVTVSQVNGNTRGR